MKVPITAPLQFKGRILVERKHLSQIKAPDKTEGEAQMPGPGADEGNSSPPLEDVLGPQWQGGTLYQDAKTRSGEARFAQVETSPGLSLPEEIQADTEAAQRLMEQNIPFAFTPSQFNDFGAAADSTLRDREPVKKAITSRQPVAWDPKTTTDQHVVRQRLNLQG